MELDRLKTEQNVEIIFDTQSGNHFTIENLYHTYIVSKICKT